MYADARYIWDYAARAELVLRVSVAWATDDYVITQLIAVWVVLTSGLEALIRPFQASNHCISQLSATHTIQ